MESDISESSCPVVENNLDLFYTWNAKYCIILGLSNYPLGSTAICSQMLKSPAHLQVPNNF